MRKAVLIRTAIWQKEDYLALSAPAMLGYQLLLQQPDVTASGVLPLVVPRWSGMTKSDAGAWIIELEVAGFVLTDEVTSELLIPSWVKYNSIGSKHEPAAVAAFQTIQSRGIRDHLQSRHPSLFGAPSDAPADGVSGFSADSLVKVEVGVEVVSSTSDEEPRVRARNHQWDGLEDVFGYRPIGREAKHWGDLCKDLAAMGATRESISDAARRYRMAMPEVELTPPALRKHYQRLMAGPENPVKAIRAGRLTPEATYAEALRLEEVEREAERGAQVAHGAAGELPSHTADPGDDRDVREEPRALPSG